ncbi:MAG: hypothetical protein BROFUL_02981 [Candidatus Brocadia fulgida]|uniref:Uncharacterized protein n=1 Tax=Candidatus Brocadia fulgida TaxID=380242 RepID=A0A0M2UV08_9BACT|nr:MAG: hypothetical protein BROFUL_02981 [Candidatus Brocadia fulgida]
MHIIIVDVSYRKTDNVRIEFDKFRLQGRYRVFHKHQIQYPDRVTFPSGGFSHKACTDRYNGHGSAVSIGNDNEDIHTGTIPGYPTTIIPLIPKE